MAFEGCAETCTSRPTSVSPRTGASSSSHRCISHPGSQGTRSGESWAHPLGATGGSRCKTLRPTPAPEDAKVPAPPGTNTEAHMSEDNGQDQQQGEVEEEAAKREQEAQEGRLQQTEQEEEQGGA